MLLPADDAIIRRQIVCPEKTLAAKYDFSRKESEHGIENRHLQEHRKAACKWIYARLTIEGHRSRLLRHWILAFMLLVDLINFRLQHAHFSTAQKVLPGNGEQDCFNAELYQ